MHRQHLPPPDSSKRLPQLDFLRAIAVLLVFGNHMTICPAETSFCLNRITTFWNRGGWVGVDLFFVLSGFLISGLLFREYQKTGGLNLSRFLIRRGFKIYPSFWFLLAVTIVVAVFFSAASPHFYRLGLLGELFFVQNYAAHIWEHTWTLAVEEHFYLGLCALFWLLLRGGREKNANAAGANPFASIPRIFVILAVGCFAMRLVTTIYQPFQYGLHIEPTHLRMDSLFFGVFISYFWHFRNLSENNFLRRRKFALGVIGLALLLPAFLFELDSNPWLAVVGLTAFYLGSGFLLLAMLYADFEKIPFLKFFARLGVYSYSIYLWNIPVQVWLAGTDADADALATGGVDNWFLYFAVYLSATLALGFGLAKLIEYPFLEARNRVFPVAETSGRLVTLEAEN